MHVMRCRVSLLRYFPEIDQKYRSRENQFVANGAFDPNLTGVGHQPRGFDQFMAGYETFTVTGSKISVNFVYDAYQGPSSEGTLGHMQNPGAPDFGAAVSPNGGHARARKRRLS